jgi:beta-phosphoglucomutase-like phosphatase (HAD superfamily)
MHIAEDNLIFDLDGTLFDSAPEILACFKKVLHLNKIEVKDNLNKSIIGPALKETLKNLVQKKIKVY